MKEVVEKDLCYGCEACATVCPVNCITMVADEWGFFYPQIDEERCIDCGKCQKQCIARKDKETARVPESCYIGVHKDERIWQASASGGAFSALVEALETKNMVVFGAGFSEDLEVCHIYAEGTDVSSMRKSKYVQSRIENAYKTAERFLEEGRRVVFTGTPCQIAGLYAALERDYENLYTIELICTGVASPLLFKRAVGLLERRYGYSLSKLDMRYKVRNENGWNIGDTRVTLASGRVLRNKHTRQYRQVYGQKVANRESCYHCRFARPERIADITIGDWWGSIEKLPQIREHKGISLILFHTRKAWELLPRLQELMYLSEVSFDEAKKDNPTLNHPTVKTKRCQAFRRDFLRLSDKQLFARYARPELKIYIPYLIAQLIPRSLREKIKGVIRR